MIRNRSAPIVIGLLAAAAAGPAYAADLSATGSWTPQVDASDLQSGAGSDLVSEKASATSQVTLDLSGLTSATDNWRVDVTRSDGSWEPGVQVWVARTSAGTGPGTVSGGSSWVEVSAIGASFFTGAGNRTGVGVQVRVTGLSVALAPETLATSLIYTIVDTP